MGREEGRATESKFPRASDKFVLFHHSMSLESQSEIYPLQCVWGGLSVCLSVVGGGNKPNSGPCIHSKPSPLSPCPSPSILFVSHSINIKRPTLKGNHGCMTGDSQRMKRNVTLKTKETISGTDSKQNREEKCQWLYRMKRTVFILQECSGHSSCALKHPSCFPSSHSTRCVLCRSWVPSPAGGAV